jgi:tRNA 2-thiouridine synthesizing protein E
VQEAAKMARAEGIEPGPDHWEVILALQEYFVRHHDKGGCNLRELHDALDEKFHHQGGMKRLYLMFPGGPVVQGCRIAGLPVPAVALDKGFGSVA